MASFGLLLAAAVLAIVIGTARLRWNTFFVLIGVAFLTGWAGGLPVIQTLGALKTGIGQTVEKIGLLILLGMTLGTLLEQSGATTRLAQTVLSRTGVQRAPAALGIMGFVVGLPIFCDAGFVVLSGILRSLIAAAPSRQVWMSVTLASSLYAVHCLVPPHPGITAAAGVLQAEIGAVLMLGLVCAVPPALIGYVFAQFFNRRYAAESPRIVENTASTDEKPLPTFTLSVLPIAVPVALLALRSAIQLAPGYDRWPVWPVVDALGDPVVAMATGIGLSLVPLRGAIQPGTLEKVLEKAGTILLLTAAGGAFGSVIQALKPGDVFGPAFASSGLGLAAPFLLAVLFKTAQGSSTVAVVSTAGLLASLLPSLGLASGTDAVLATLAMGAGSMAVSHTNDSYFWVVSRFSGLPPEVALRAYSTTTAVMGIAGFVAVLLVKLVL